MTGELGKIEITPASVEDAEEILALQYLAYQVEAILYDDWQIPPLLETLEEVRADIAAVVVLKACSGGRVVGSVRGTLRPDATCYVGRLIVHPDWRRRGIATDLMRELEARFPGATGFELWTGWKSAGNMALYRSLGYEETGRDTHPRVPVVVMRKDRPAQ